MKKPLAVLLALLLACGTLVTAQPARVAHADEVKTISAAYLNGMPAIDGELTETEWGGRVNTPITTDLSGNSTHSASFGALWDYDYLYVAAQIADPERASGFDPTEGIWGHADLVSLFFDSTLHESSPYIASDLQIGFAASGDGFAPRVQLGGGVVKDGAESARILDSVFAAYHEGDSSWSIEIAIPWEAVGIDPYLATEIGFDISADDVHSDGSWEYLYWETRDKTSFWNDTAGFGRLQLNRSETVQAASDVVFSEDFEDATTGQAPASFKATKGAVSVVDTGGGAGKVLAIGNSANENEFNTALARLPKGIGDYKLEADLSFANVRDTGRWSSLMFRVQNEDRPYFQFATRQNGGVEFAHRTAGNGWDVRSNATVPAYTLNSFSHLSAQVVNNMVTETVNDQNVIESDRVGDYLAGNVGAQSNFNQTYIDNFKVTRIAAASLAVGVPSEIKSLDVFTATVEADYTNGPKGIAVGAA
ncbi:MAG: hypothetical protein LBP28_02175, partial [Coriobacteriales bacterium]|nr:hypothetical protein [Coriobacteriales bacterium]